MSAKVLILVALLCIGSPQLTSATGCGDKCFFGFCSEGSCTGGVCKCKGVDGDPELEGLDGRRFFFDGEANATFNLITEEHHQLNAFFVEGPHKIAKLGSTEAAKNGTWVGSMGFKINGQKVQVDTDDEGAMIVVVNGKEVMLTKENNYENVQTFDKLNVTTHKYRQGLGETVELQSDVYSFILYAVPKAYDEATQQMNRGHLNMGMGVNADTYFTRTIHGVLGQITPNSHPDVSALPEELREAFLGEGEESDYKVSDLFADDFQFNLFGKPAPRKMAVSRRHLKEASSAQQWLTVGFFGSDSAPRRL